LLVVKTIIEIALFILLVNFNYLSPSTGRFIMFSVITNIYNKETKEPTLMEFFTPTGKLKKFFFF